MTTEFQKGDRVKYKIHAENEEGKVTDEILEEGEAEVIDIGLNGNLTLDNRSGLIALPEECEKINNMTTKQKIEAIKEAIEKAKNHQSKMDETAWAVPALSSLKIRHLMNNLGAISTTYLECGVHKGGLFCSTIRNNANIERAYAIDNWASDADGQDKAYPQFLENVRKCMVDGFEFYSAVQDTFKVPIQFLSRGYDLYLYDAAHDYESQRKAMTHFLPAMAEEFIVCVDDYDWRGVREGTEAGLMDAIASVEVLFEETFIGNDHDNDGWWNGFYVALLKKK